jgi:large subunit ribosomal protein L4
LAALKSALSLLLGEGRLTVVEDLQLAEIKTKALVAVLSALNAPREKALVKTLVVDAKDNDKLQLSIRNLQGNSFLPPEGVNVYDLLRHEHLIVTKRAVEALEARCTREAT